MEVTEEEQKEYMLNGSRVIDGGLHIELSYPRSNPIKRIQIGLECVRAADDIRVSYDFERDGWKIEQAGKFEWEDGEEIDEDWQEVAFIQAWGREKKPD